MLKKKRLKILTSWFWKPWPHKFPYVVHTNLTFKTYGIAKNTASNQAPEINPYLYRFPVVEDERGLFITYNLSTDRTTIKKVDAFRVKLAQYP